MDRDRSAADEALPDGSGEESGLVVSHRDLSREALLGVIEAFVLQEGTDYGDHEYSLHDKVAQVERQLERGEAKLVYNPRTASVSIVTER